jgi:hypothetical protein
VLEPEYSCEINGLFWRVRVDSNRKGHTIALSFGSSHKETSYVETKHQWNLRIEALSTKTHVVDVINIWKMNLRKKRKPY